MHLEPRFRTPNPEAPLIPGQLVREVDQGRDSWHGEIGVVEWCEPSRIGVGPITWVAAVFWPEVAEKMVCNGQTGPIGHSPRTRYLAENLIPAHFDEEEYVEPNPYHIDLRLSDAPFYPGDVVRYVGNTGHIGNYSTNQEEGVILYCRRTGGPGTDWSCSVDWSPPGKPRSKYGGMSRARYLAKNLRLVRPNLRDTGWRWPHVEALRAEDV